MATVVDCLIVYVMLASLISIGLRTVTSIDDVTASSGASPSAPRPRRSSRATTSTCSSSSTPACAEHSTSRLGLGLDADRDRVLEDPLRFLQELALLLGERFGERPW